MTEPNYFGAAMTSSWAITEYLQDKHDAKLCPDVLKKAKNRYDRRMKSCAKRFGFKNVTAMKIALRARAEAIEKAREEQKP